MDELIEPEEWLSLTNEPKSKLAEVCCVEPTTVYRWFLSSSNARQPSDTIRKILWYDLKQRGLI